MFHTFTATKICNFFGVFARFMKKLLSLRCILHIELLVCIVKPQTDSYRNFFEDGRKYSIIL